MDVKALPSMYADPITFFTVIYMKVRTKKLQQII
jgi:ketosteroid isomerase-like protein